MDELISDVDLQVGEYRTESYDIDRVDLAALRRNMRTPLKGKSGSFMIISYTVKDDTVDLKLFGLSNV